MEYITMNIVIVKAQDVSKQLQKDQHPVKITTKSIDTHA